MIFPSAAQLYLIDRDGHEVRLWPSAHPVPEGTFQEARTYIIELREIRSPDQVELYIDDQLAEALRSPTRTTARWRWSPGFYAGELNVRITGPHGMRLEFNWIIDPDLRKLTRRDFDIMVQEVLEDTLALFSLSPVRFGVGQGAAGLVPPIARLEYLRSRVSEIEAVVKKIAANPVRVLRGVEEWVDYHRVGKITGEELLKSLRGPRVLTAQNRQTRLPAALADHWPAKVRKKVRTEGLDLREHRNIKATLNAWASWLSAIAELLAASNPTDPELRATRHVWSRRCRSLSRRLSRLVELPVFRGVSESRVPLATTPIFRRVPAYRSFFRLHREFKLGITNVLGDFLDLPLARTFDLYELWAFLRLLRAATLRFDLRNFDLSELFTGNSRRGAITISSGPVNVQLTPELSLRFKRSYREYWLEEDGLGSFSRTMQPDISMQIVRADELKVIIIIDAKYRIEQQLNEAIASIHTYRDALVEDSTAGGPRQVVASAYIVSPHIPNYHPTWRASPMPGRLFHPVYRADFRFGAVSLRPGMSLSEIQSTFEVLLSDSGYPNL